MLISHAMFFLFQAEDGIRYLVRSRGLGDVYKRQSLGAVLMRVRKVTEVRSRGHAPARLAGIREEGHLSLIHI